MYDSFNIQIPTEKSLNVFDKNCKRSYKLDLTKFSIGILQGYLVPLYAD